MATLEIVMVIAVIILALYLFFKEVFPVDVSAIIIMVTLMVLRLVTPEQGISGFSNSAVITILAMFILSKGIERTGVIHILSLRLFGIVGSNQFLQLLLVMILVAPFSGFLNNAAVVAVLMPFVMNLSKVSKTPASKLLIPLSYVSMAAGMLTIIGTSTNLLANATLMELGLEPFGMFDFWRLGIIVLGVAILYFLLIGFWLLPKRNVQGQESYQDSLDYIFEVKISEGSSLAGKKIKDSIMRKKYKVRVLGLHRENMEKSNNFSNIILREGDILTIEAPTNILINLESEPGIRVSSIELHKKQKPEETFQMIIPHNSTYIGKNIEDLHLDKKYKAVVVAVRKGEKKLVGRLGKIKLRLGDMLIVKTTSEYATRLNQDPNLMTIDSLDSNFKKDKVWISLAIMVGVIGIAAIGIYPILVTALAGVIAMFLTGVLTFEEAYNSVRWEVIFLLAGLIPLGIALQNSGAAAFIASAIGSLAANLPVLWVVVGFYVFTSLLTEVLSNNATVILLVPIGINLAINLGITPYILVLAIMFAASTSFLTPIGYQTNTMVYGTGVYKFSDFFRVGILLNIIFSIVTPLLILRMWG
jgi:di/tricarboxylate transporter